MLVREFIEKTDSYLNDCVIADVYIIFAFQFKKVNFFLTKRQSIQRDLSIHSFWKPDSSILK